MKASLPWTRPPNSPVPNTTAGETEGGAVGVGFVVTATGSPPQAGGVQPGEAASLLA